MKITEKIHELIFGSYPDDIAPTIRLGYVHGEMRMENTQDREFSVPGGILLGVPPIPSKEGGFDFISHQQKRSKWGFLIQSPFGLFAWKLDKFQDNSKGTWIPGSEKGWVFRSPGWRMDVPGSKIDGVLRHFIPTWGHFGRHLD